MDETEATIRQRWDAGELDAAMTAAVEAYGDKLYGFLVGLSGDHDRAGDVFGAVCERVWLALPKFRWESTLRVWMYTIARNEFLTGANRAKRQVPLSAVTQAAVQKVRTSTPPYLRTDVKDRFAKVREELPPDDFMLLGLRLDQRMSWNDIARVLGSGQDAELVREAAAFRKRFARLKERLEELAAELLDDG